MKTIYSLVHLTDITCPPPELIRTAAKVGFDAVSLRTIPMGLVGENPFNIAKDHRLFADTKKAAEETGILIHDTENARIAVGVNVANYEADLDAAARLGIHHILCNIWTDDKEFYTDQFGQLCDLAKEYNQIVSLEFVTWASVTNLKSAMKLLQDVQKNNTGIVLDCLHFYRSRVTVEELEKCPKELFHYVHLCDCEKAIPDDKESLIFTGREARLYPGEGAIPLRKIISKVPQAVRGVECPNVKRIKLLGREEHFRRCLEFAKKFA